MEDGTLASVGKIKGAKRVLAEFIRIMHERGCNVKDYPVEVLQADCPETGDAFVAALKEEFGAETVIHYQPVGPVIGTHCGPGTLGLVFYAEN